MADTKILQEKLKYLMQLESESNEFEIFDLILDFYHLDSGYALLIKFDYLGAIDTQMPHFLGDVGDMMEKMRTIVSKVTVTPEIKISLTQDVIVESFIDKIDFSAEEKHIFTVSFVVHYIDKN